MQSYPSSQLLFLRLNLLGEGLNILVVLAIFNPFPVQHHTIKFPVAPSFRKMWFSGLKQIKRENLRRITEFRFAPESVMRFRHKIQSQAEV